MAMNQDERRLAMLRQRGELPPEPEENEGQPEERKKTSGGRRGSGPERKAPAKNTYFARREKLRKQRQRQKLIRLGLYAGAVIVVILVLITVIRGCVRDEPSPKQTNSLLGPESTGEQEGTDEPQTPSGTSAEAEAPSTSAEVIPAAVTGQGVDISGIRIPSWITQDFLTVNDKSRPQIYLEDVSYIAIHWVGNAGTTAKNNRDYFENLGNPDDPAYGRKASAQLIVGLEGEVIQCMPLNEMAYAVKDRYNPHTISIEVCHPDDEGKFSDITYQSLIRLAAWLLQQFDLGEDALLRHHDCDQKDCPKYYVVHEDAWEQMKADIMYYYRTHPNIS